MRSRALALVVLAGAALSAQARERITPSALVAHIRQLAADDLGGRGNGTEGLERAADYITRQFRAAGLAGGGDAGTFDQRFQAEVRIEPPADSSIVLTSPAGTDRLLLGHDFYPVSLLDHPPDAAPTSASPAPVVFAGYGISAPGLGYDDFAGLDVRDAAVLVFTHEPQEHDARSVFDGANLTPGAALSAKAREARERGARLLMVVEDPSHADDRAIGGAWFADPQSDHLGLPVVRVSRDRIARALPDLDLAWIAESIDRRLEPRSGRVAGVTVSYVEHRAQFAATLRNIVGVVRASDSALAHEAIVVGAHYDHVGTGGRASEAPEATGQVHNGADDNASGAAALIEMARLAARTRARFRRTLVFAAFAGEELGLRGSSYYVSHPAVPLDRTAAMINLDMVGRARGRVLVGVFGKAARLSTLPGRLRPWTRLTIQDFSRGGYGVDQSDVGAFASRGVPSVAFFTGFHADYHRPSDDWPRIDAEGVAEVARLALRLVEDLAR